MITSTSSFTPVVAIQLHKKLPVELIEQILVRIPLSSVLELCIPHDENSESQAAASYIMDCALGFPPWRSVLIDRKTLEWCRETFKYIAEAFYLLYQRPYNHFYGSTKQTGVTQAEFQPLRQILSTHRFWNETTTESARPTLKGAFIKCLDAIWKKQQPSSIFQQRQSRDSRERTLPPKEEFNEWISRSGIPQGLTYNPNVTHEDVEAFVDYIIDVDLAKPALFTKNGFYTKEASWVFRMAIIIDRFWLSQLSEELEYARGLMKSHPAMLKKLRDHTQHGRPNVDHILQGLTNDSKLVSFVGASKKTLRTGMSRFNTPHLPVQLLNKHLWFFLECRARLLGIGGHNTVDLQLPLGMQADMERVLNGLAYIQSHDLSNDAKLENHMPGFVRNDRHPGTLNKKYPDEASTEQPMPRITIDDSAVDLLGDEYPAGANPARQPTKEETAKLMTRISLGLELRPRFTTSWEPRLTVFQRHQQRPHDAGEYEFLDAFLRCCKFFEQQFPDVLNKIEKEAKKTYPPCKIAEQRYEYRLTQVMDLE